jgi:transposase
MYMTILTLHKQGTSQRQIAKLTKTDRKTVRRIIDQYKNQKIEEPISCVHVPKASIYHQQIVDLIGCNISNVRIYEELQKSGYKGSYSGLNRYIKKHKIKLDTCIRFHSLPGQEAQVDFGDIGKRYDPQMRLRKACVFNMRLSYSRYDYFEIVFDQKIETWINCHINAFNHFGGAPEVIKLDNLKSGVIDPSFYEPIFQKDYKRFADHYECLLSPCRVYQPQEKGKVESGIKYVKNNFFAGREFDGYADMVEQLKEWNEKANSRIHGTTKAKPIDLFFESEKAALKKLPNEEFSIIDWQVRKVGKDCHIHLYNNYYSVPAKYAHADVEIAVTANLVKIYDGRQANFSVSSDKTSEIDAVKGDYKAKGNNLPD